MVAQQSVGSTLLYWKSLTKDIGSAPTSVVDRKLENKRKKDRRKRKKASAAANSGSTINVVASTVEIQGIEVVGIQSDNGVVAASADEIRDTTAVAAQAAETPQLEVVAMAIQSASIQSGSDIMAALAADGIRDFYSINMICTEE